LKLFALPFWAETPVSVLSTSHVGAAPTPTAVQASLIDVTSGEFAP
jgi:hypothetical protein